MRPLKIKDRCVKKRLTKCDEVVRLYDKIQIAYADILEEDDEVISIACNVPLVGLATGEFTSDFLCVKKNGERLVRECIWRKKLALPRTARLLQESQEYWLKRGVLDWGIVVEKAGDCFEQE